MSKIDELIIKLCPNGVEYKRLEEISTFERGKGFKKDDKGTGNSPIIFYGELYTTYGDYIDKIVSFVDEKRVANKVFVKKGDIVLPISSTTAEAQIGKASVMKVDNVILGSDAIVIHHNINSSYLMYYINSKIFEFYKMKCVSGTTIRHLSPKEMMKIKVAIPPLEVQCKIANILDEYTSVSLSITEEIEKELKARQKQYEYYENKLLFNDKYTKVKLEDVCIVNQGLQIPINQRKKEKKDNCYFYITVQFLKGGNEEYYIENPPESVICHKDDILVTRTGSTGKIITGVEGCFHNNFFKVTTNDKIYKKFLYYILNSKYMYNKMLAVASGGTVPDLPHKKFYNLEIPLPSIEEQKKLAEIMERLLKVSNDILEELPAEIEARQKQYEYYRDKLLTFKELVNEG